MSKNPNPAPMTRELHTFHRPRLREASEGDTPSRCIEGYAIVFNEPSQVLVDWWDAYREVILPTALTQADLDKWDIQMTLWHNRERLLARVRGGEGTLSLTLDERGVRYSFDAPYTPDGDTALELVRRGDISGASFTFYLNESNCRYEDNDDGVITRYIERIERVSECTLTSNPAYPSTTASAEREAPAAVRSLPAYAAKHPEVPAPTEAEREARLAELQAFRNAAKWR